MHNLASKYKERAMDSYQTTACMFYITNYRFWQHEYHLWANQVIKKKNSWKHWHKISANLIIPVLYRPIVSLMLMQRNGKGMIMCLITVSLNEQVRINHTIELNILSQYIFIQYESSWINAQFFIFNISILRFLELMMNPNFVISYLA